MDESFLIENHLTLRAYQSLGSYCVTSAYVTDTNFFGDSSKSYNRDLFLFLCFLLIIYQQLPLSRYIMISQHSLGNPYFIFKNIKLRSGKVGCMYCFSCTITSQQQKYTMLYACLLLHMYG